MAVGEEGAKNGLALPQARPSPRPHPRPAFAACVGIMSRPVTPRRAVVRDTWLRDVRALEAGGVYARFVVGRPPPGGAGAGGAGADPAAVEAALAQEGAAHGDLLRVPTLEAYDSLLLKVLAFYRAALVAVDASFYIKTDDDVFARLDRLPAAAAQWAGDGAGYVGCMFLGGQMIADPASVYYEPHGALFAGGRYYGYMSGGFYALSQAAASLLARKDDGEVRLMGCGDDCSVGLQMLAAPVRFVEDWRVCTYGCRATSIVVTDACNGLCEPLAAMPRLASQANCTGGGSGEAAIGPLWAPPNQRFVGRAAVDAMDCAVIRGGQVDRSACRKPRGA